MQDTSWKTFGKFARAPNHIDHPPVLQFRQGEELSIDKPVCTATFIHAVRIQKWEPPQMIVLTDNASQSYGNSILKKVLMLPKRKGGSNNLFSCL